MEQRRPADPRLLWGFWALAAAGILLFIVLLRADLRETRPLDAARYTEAAPAGFGYGCEATPGEGVLTFRGWAAVEGEKLETVDCRLVLYSPGEDRYYRLPTTMDPGEEAAAATGDPDAGFYAFALADQLPAGELELCFAYRSNGHNALIRTGQIVGGAL